MPEKAWQRRERGASYVPLQITARMRCGVISDGLLPIDSVLYYAAHRELLAGQHAATRPRELTISETDDRVGRLPLKRIATYSTPDWYHAASCAVWPEAVADGIDHWTKKLDSRYVELLEQQRARVPTSGGRYRAYHMPVAYRHALTIAWYVVGDPARISDLLRLVTHLGKKPSMGWGAVAEWSVEPSEEDYSVTGPHGEVMRPIPDDAGILYGVRPPYWLPRNQVPCRMPSTAVAS